MPRVWAPLFFIYTSPGWEMGILADLLCPSPGNYGKFIQTGSLPSRALCLPAHLAGFPLMNPLEKMVWEDVRRRDLIRQGDTGLVCVSGGGDSTALMHLLAALARPLKLSLTVVHFNHGLRPEAPQEALRVAQQAAKLGLAAVVEQTDHLAGRTGIQAAARHWRQSRCRELARQTGAAWAATGHQREDQMETLLLKLLRGVHLTGLKGMDPKQGLFIRPLLAIRHGRLTDYLKEKGETWLEDPSNANPRYKRNRVRHELIPLMEELAGGALGDRLGALEAQSTLVRQWLETVSPVEQSPAPHETTSTGEADPPWMAIPPLMEMPPLARMDQIHRFVQGRIKGPVDFCQLTRVLSLLETGQGRWQVNLSLNRTLKREKGRLWLTPTRQTG